MGGITQSRPTSLEQELTRASAAKAELNRRLFQIGSLYETVRELTGTTDSAVAMERFLLMVLATFDAGRGFILCHDKTSSPPLVARWGGSGSPGTGGEDMERRLIEELGPFLEHTIPKAMTIERLQEIPGLERLGLGTIMALRYAVDDDVHGLVALVADSGQATKGPALSEWELFEINASNFMVVLGNIRSMERIGLLNMSLTAQNQELRKTIEDLTAARRAIEALEEARYRLKSAIRQVSDKISRASALDISLILFIGVVVGLLFNTVSPGVDLVPETMRREPLPRIEATEARMLISGNDAVLVDARPPEFYAQGHLQGALNIPPMFFDFAYTMLFTSVDPESEVIVYGRTFSRHYHEEVGKRLMLKGYEKVRLLEDGLGAMMDEQRKEASR